MITRNACGLSLADIASRQMQRRHRYLGFSAAAAIALCAGCVQRELEIHSNPEGALISLNDQEVGRTPATVPFTFYGTYDVILRKEGYETLKTKKFVLAPWWQWVPFDLPAELFPLTDHQRIGFELHPTTQHAVSPEELMFRAVQLREKLPATQPAAEGTATSRRSTSRPHGGASTRR